MQVSVICVIVSVTKLFTGMMLLSVGVGALGAAYLGHKVIQWNTRANKAKLRHKRAKETKQNVEKMRGKCKSVPVSTTQSSSALLFTERHASVHS